MILLSEFPIKVPGGRKPKIYNLDMILSVGYRVNSKRSIAFRRWAMVKRSLVMGSSLLLHL